MAKYEDKWHDDFKELTSDQLSQHKVHMTDGILGPAGAQNTLDKVQGQVTIFLAW